MKLNLNKKYQSIIKIFFIGLFFICFTGKAYAFDDRLLKEKEDKIELSKRDSGLILESFTSKISEKRMTSIITEASSEKEAILVLLKNGININTISYAITQAPKEVIADFLKIGAKITSLAVDPTFSSFLKIGVDELKKHAIKWLVKNELRVSSGNLSISSYKSFDDSRESVALSYILVYNPRNNKIEIKIYSPLEIKPPKSEGGITGYLPGISGNHWNQEEWLKNGNTKLPPFTINITGEIVDGSYGGYRWISGPNIEIDLSSPVPKFELREMTSIDRELSSLNKALIAAKRAFEIVQGAIDTAKSAVSNISQSIWGGIKSGISRIGSMGEAAITSVLLSPTDRSTIISLQEGIRKIEESNKDKPAEPDSPAESSDKIVEELRKRILDLENELKKSIQEEEKVKESIVARVNINTASKNDLMKIIHIGPARADEIIRLRPFYSIDDLIIVPGIGEKIITDIKIQGIAYVDIIKDDILELEKEEKVDEEVDSPKENPCSSGVDINKDSLKDLTFITGIGETIAQRIIDHRISNAFYSLDDLLAINGIGPTTLQKIKEQGCAYTNASNPNKPNNSSDKENDKKEELIDDSACSENSIEINTANKANLEKIINIGPAYAEQIIALRAESPFISLDDLARVSGISLGGARLNQIKEQGCAHINESLLPKEEVLEIIIEGAESIWSPSLSLDSRIINTPTPSQSLSEIFISHGETVWSSTLDPWESSFISSPSLPDIFISYGDSIWTQTIDGEIVESTKLVKNLEIMLHTEESNENIDLFMEPEEDIPINKPEGIELEDEDNSPPDKDTDDEGEDEEEIISQEIKEQEDDEEEIENNKDE